MPANILSLILFSAFAIPLSIIDARSYRLPDALTIPCFCSILLTILIFDARSLSSSLIAAALGCLLFLLTRSISRGLGLGDVKLAASVGLLCGFPGFMFAFSLAAISALLACLVLIGMRKLKRSSPIPFGPFISFGAIIVKAYAIIAGLGMNGFVFF